MSELDKVVGVVEDSLKNEKETVAREHFKKYSQALGIDFVRFEDVECKITMSVTEKKLEFAGWDVHMFDDDERIDELIDAQGWTGFSIYFYLSMKAFATNGFYYSWRDTSPASIARRMSGGVKSETVKEVVNLCLRIGLFDKGLYDREGVLTNKDIQIGNIFHKTNMTRFPQFEPGENEISFSSGVTEIMISYYPIYL